MERDEHLDHLRADVERFAAALERGPLDAPVSWCGEWRLADLGVHLGGVHRWATSCVLTGRPGAPEPDPAPADGPGLAAWLRAGGVPLVDALAAVDLDGPTWHPFPVPRVGRVWPRRQAQETSVHRWDAERAVGLDPGVDPALAADGIDEYFALALPRLMAREGVVPPNGPLLRAHDRHRRLVGRRSPATVRSIAAGDDEPAATITGSAEHVLLALWCRPVPDGAVSVDGDPTWLELGGI